MARFIKPKTDLESYTVKINFLFISLTVQLHQNVLSLIIQYSKGHNTTVKWLTNC